jgi:hypothetical protein
VLEDEKEDWKVLLFTQQCQPSSFLF